MNTFYRHIYFETNFSNLGSFLGGKKDGEVEGLGNSARVRATFCLSVTEDLASNREKITCGAFK